MKFHNCEARDPIFVFGKNGNRPRMKQEILELCSGIGNPGPETGPVQRQERVNIVAPDWSKANAIAVLVLQR